MGMKIICIWQKYWISYNHVQKTLKKLYENVHCTQFPYLYAENSPKQVDKPLKSINQSWMNEWMNKKSLKCV